MRERADRVDDGRGRWVAAAKVPVQRVLGVAGGVISGRTDAPIAALTFDDGPCRASTPGILDVLDRHGATGTFFLLGARAVRDPGLVREIAARGHVVGVHGWEHESIVRDAPAALWPRLQWRAEQQRRTAHALRPWGRRLYRPPFGHTTMPSRVLTAARRYQTIMWTFSARDWTDASADEIVARVQTRLAPGSIVLLHDAVHDRCERRRTLEEALDTILEEADGYAWVGVPELLARAPARFGFRFGPVDRTDIPGAAASADPCRHP